MKGIVSLNERYVRIINLTWGNSNSNFDADLLLSPAVFWWFQFPIIFLVRELTSLPEET